MQAKTAATARRRVIRLLDGLKYAWARPGHGAAVTGSVVSVICQPSDSLGWPVTTRTPWEV
jgi:hypothetical protein